MKTFTLLILLVTFQYTLYADEHSYKDTKSGISFHYPDIVILNKESSKKSPVSAVFTYGTAPFSSSVIYKEIEGSENIQNFIKKEHNAQIKGGYKKDVIEKNTNIDENTETVEWIRKTPFGSIYYFVFPSLKEHKLYAFYHVTSKNADPDQIALKAYELMKKTLILEK